MHNISSPSALSGRTVTWATRNPKIPRLVTINCEAFAEAKPSGSAFFFFFSCANLLLFPLSFFFSSIFTLTVWLVHNQQGARPSVYRQSEQDVRFLSRILSKKKKSTDPFFLNATEIYSTPLYLSLMLYQPEGAHLMGWLPFPSLFCVIHAAEQTPPRSQNDE